MKDICRNLELGMMNISCIIYEVFANVGTIARLNENRGVVFTVHGDGFHSLYILVYIG